MMTFEEYQSTAATTPLSLRNDRDRINLPVLGLQTDAGKVGFLLASAFGSGKLRLTPDQTGELRDRLSDMLWYIALICGETGMALQDVAVHSLARLQARAKTLDPDQR
jgi:hypothetical protein